MIYKNAKKSLFFLNGKDKETKCVFFLRKRFRSSQNIFLHD